MDLIGEEKPQSFENTSVQVTDIGERMWPHLGPKARRLLNTGIQNAVIQFDRGKEDGKIYQLKPIWCKETQTRPDQEYERETKIMVPLLKVVNFDEEPKDMPDEWVRRFALLVDKLAEDDKISYGVLGPPIFFSLAKLEGKPHRLMFCLYCFSDFEREELNKWLGNEAFIEEGGIGTDDWQDLPE